MTSKKPVIKGVADYTKFFKKIPESQWCEGLHEKHKNKDNFCAIGHLGAKLGKKKDIVAGDIGEHELMKIYPQIDKLQKLFLKHFDTTIENVNDGDASDQTEEEVKNSYYFSTLPKEKQERWLLQARLFHGLKTPRARILAACEYLEKKISKKGTKKSKKKAKSIRKTIKKLKKHDDFVLQTAEPAKTQDVKVYIDS